MVYFYHICRIEITDPINEGKDIQLPTNQRPNKIQAFAHLFIAGGSGLLSITFMSVVGILVATIFTGFSVSDLVDPETLTKMQSDTNAMRILTFFGSSLALILASIVTVMAIPIMSNKWETVDIKTFLSLNRVDSIKWFALSVLFFFTCLPIMSSLLEWNMSWDLSRISPTLKDWASQMEIQNNKTYDVLFGERNFGNLLINLLLMALLPALAEEFFFRGVLLNIFHGLFKNIHVAIIVCAFLFSLIHFQAFKILPMMSLAIAFGYMVYWTGSVWTSVAAHFANNAIAVITLYFTKDGSYIEMLKQEQSMAWPYVIAGSALMLLLAFFIHKNAQPKLSNYYE
ncbi:MAG: CPBP family intramembrane metalloprotease [Bacteroidia bacterium]